MTKTKSGTSGVGLLLVGISVVIVGLLATDKLPRLPGLTSNEDDGTREVTYTVIAEKGPDRIADVAYRNDWGSEARDDDASLPWAKTVTLTTGTTATVVAWSDWTKNGVLRCEIMINGELADSEITHDPEVSTRMETSVACRTVVS